ncbi:helix-turn-helix domain-containing protein [Streptomyces sp. NPDC003688]
MTNRSCGRGRSQDGSASAPSASAAGAARAARCTKAFLDISEDITAVAATLLSNAHDSTSTEELLMTQVVAIKSLLEEATGALIVSRRSQGKPISDLAELLNLSEDRVRKKYRPQNVDDALLNRGRPKRTPSADSTMRKQHAQASLRSPRERLACALTLMWRASGYRQHEIADRLRVKPSYVSKMISGQRQPSWQHVLAICAMCKEDSELMKPLWEAAVGAPPTGADPVTYLRTYLKALCYAAGSPGIDAILASAKQALTAADLRHALHGPDVPAWTTVNELVVALQGLPQIAKPLWDRAQAHAATTECN